MGGRQGKQLPAIGRPRLPPTTPHAGNNSALLCGSGERQCPSTRENPLVTEACRATSAGVHFFWKKFCEDALGQGLHLLRQSSDPEVTRVPPPGNLCPPCGGRAAFTSTWHLPGYENPSLQPWAGCHPCGMGLSARLQKDRQSLSHFNLEDAFSFSKVILLGSIPNFCGKHQPLIAMNRLMPHHFLAFPSLLGISKRNLSRINH